MFALRLSRKAKVMRLDVALQQAVPPGAHLPLPAPTPYSLGGRGVPATIATIVARLPRDAADLLHHAGGLQAAVRERMSMPARPPPDVRGESLLIHDFAISWSGANKIRVHARPSYYGHVRYDWVTTQGAGAWGEEWSGRILLFFSCVVDGVRREFMLLRWLDRVDVLRDHVLGATHFVYWNRPPKVEIVSTIVARADFVTSPLLHAAGRQVFLRLPYNTDGVVGDDDDA